MNSAVKVNINTPERERLYVDNSITTIRLAGIIEDSVVDGPGVRFVVFVQGCMHNCKGCHNIHAQDFQGGFYADINKLAEKIIKSRTSKITFSGGEPFCSANELAKLSEIVRKKKNIEIFTYTGYLYEDLLEMAEERKDIHRLLSATNYLKDGKFELEKKTFGAFYRGSSNQRILDVTDYPRTKKPRMIKTREDFYGENA